MAKKADALGQAHKFRYFRRSSKNGPRDQFDQSEQYRKKQYVNPFTFEKKAFCDSVKSQKNNQ